MILVGTAGLGQLSLQHGLAGTQQMQLQAAQLKLHTCLRPQSQLPREAPGGCTPHWRILLTMPVVGPGCTARVELIQKMLKLMMPHHAAGECERFITHTTRFWRKSTVAFRVGAKVTVSTGKRNYHGCAWLFLGGVGGRVLAWLGPGLAGTSNLHERMEHLGSLSSFPGCEERGTRKG